MNRRDFLKVSAAAGGSLVLAMQLPGCSGPQDRMNDILANKGQFSPNVFVTITPEDTVRLAVPKSEMGQGVFTGYASLIAEELEVDLDRVVPYHADGAPEYRISMGMQQTGGSTSMKEGYFLLRRAAATAREMLIGAAAAQWGHPASECEADRGMVHHRASGKKMRYGQLLEQAATREIPESPTLKDPKDFRIIGKRSTRVDARSKVDGSAVYGLDFQVGGMLRALVLRPPVFGATAQEVKAQEAKKMPGVVDVFAFERGVAVVAEKYWQAQRAATKVEVRWGEGLTEGLNSDELFAACARRAEEEGATSVRDDGDVEAIFEQADRKQIDVRYEVPYLAHAPMEPMNATAWVTEDRCEIWAPSQSATVMQETGAQLTGFSRDDVIAHTTMLGGGFGRRGVQDFVAEALMISKRLARPVQVVWSREDDMTLGFYRPMAHTRMRGALDANNKPVALHYHSVAPSIFASLDGMMVAAIPTALPAGLRKRLTKSVLSLIRTGSLPDFVATEGVRELAYDIANVRVEYTPLHTAMPVSFWRSVGHSYNGFIVESFLDELAHLAGADPYTFRREAITSSPRDREVLDRAAKLGNWGKPLADGWGRGIAVQKSFGTYVAEVVEAGVVDGRIKLGRIACVVDCGTAVNPDVVRAQMEGGILYGLSAGLKQEVTFKDGVIEQDNFNTFPSLRMFETPEIVVEIVENQLPPTGVGEPGLPPSIPALANAIFAATGVRLRKLPLQKAWREHAGANKESK